MYIYLATSLGNLGVVGVKSLFFLEVALGVPNIFSLGVLISLGVDRGVRVLFFLTIVGAGDDGLYI
jgi:hypothetical protein